MRCFERILELGKCLHEFARGLARSDIPILTHPEIADKTGQKALDRTDSLKRQVHQSMPETSTCMTDFLLHECSQVDMLYDELDTLDSSIKLGTSSTEETNSVLRLILSKQHKPDKEHERYEYEEEVRHG